MSDNKLIVIERVGVFQRVYHVNAKLRNGVPSTPKPLKSILEVVSQNIDAVVEATYNDHSSIKIRIGKAWMVDWDEVDERMLWLIIGWLDWPFEDVQIQEMSSQGTTAPRSTPLEVQELGEDAEKWANARDMS